MYGRVGEDRTFVPAGTPVLALTATVTKAMRLDICNRLEMTNYEYVYTSPERSNIYYEVCNHIDVETDLKYLVDELCLNKIGMPRVIIFCRSLNMCAGVYAIFLSSLGVDSYYPPGAPDLSGNKLYRMFHAHTPPHNKGVILNSI